MSLLRVSRARPALASLLASSGRRAFTTFDPVAESRFLRFAHNIEVAQVAAPFHAQLAARAPCFYEKAFALSSDELPRVALSSAPASSSAFLVALPLSNPETMWTDSTKRKRARKMNKHKWKKRLKAQRRRSRKDLAQ